MIYPFIASSGRPKGSSAVRLPVPPLDAGTARYLEGCPAKRGYRHSSRSVSRSGPSSISGEARLRTAVRRFQRPASPAPPPLDPSPSNPFEIVVAERLRAMQKELDQIRSRLNWLLTLIVGAAITNVVLAILG